MKETIIKTDKLCKSFKSGSIVQNVLKNLDIEIYQGDFTVIMGPSGCGKSTLLYALSGMDTPTGGEVNFGGVDIAKFNQDKLAVFRRKNCGFVFQQIYLVDSLSITDNILSSGFLVNNNKKQVKEAAESLLKAVGLEENLWHKLPNQISGGEAQRVGIVRALINSPKILFADEPTGALNSTTGKYVLDVFSDFNNKGQSIVMVTHDIKSALRGNRILFMRDGVIDGELNLGAYDESASRLDKMMAFLQNRGF